MSLRDYEKLLDSAGRFNPRCDWPGCKAWGSHGRGVALNKGRRGVWYCAAHDAEAEKNLANAQSARGPAPDPRQSRFI